MRDNYVIIRDCNKMSYSGQLIGSDFINGEKFVVLKQSVKSDIKLYIPIGSCYEIIRSNGQLLDINLV